MSSIPGPWLALSRLTGRLDPRPLLRALQVPVERASRAQLLAAGFTPAQARVVLETQAHPDPGPWVPIGEAAYPSALLDLARPPPVVWIEGDRGVLERPALAVVGSRRCTAYGRRIASQLGSSVARHGGCLVSGAARGIDTAAHRGALDGEGATVAVLGGGLRASSDGPAGALHRRILDEGGALVSEMPPDDPPSRFTFPRRNRIIAALGRATVVVEAGKRSGALYTSEAADGLGRPVFAVPGRLGESASVGCLDLIAGGARLLREIGDALVPLGPPPGTPGRILGALGTPASPELITRRTGLPSREVLGGLAMLELTGAVQRCTDGRYARR